MSAKYTFLAWETPIENAPLKLTLLQLANNADDAGFSYYSISKMAVSCGMSERTFMRKIGELEVMNILTVERRSNRPSLYTLIGDEMGVTLCHLHRPEVTESHPEVTESHLLGDRESPDPNNTPNTLPNNKDLLREKEIELLEVAFQLFYSAGLPKKNPKGARKSFLSLAKKLKSDKSIEFDPMDLAKTLKRDIEYRLSTKEFGFNNLHPATYLNKERWLDEYETAQQSNNGYAQGDRKLSASERIRASNELKYGSQQPSGGLGLATNGGDIREPMDSGEWGNTIENVEDRT